MSATRYASNVEGKAMKYITYSVGGILLSATICSICFFCVWYAIGRLTTGVLSFILGRLITLGLKIMDCLEGQRISRN
jgi:hypothetical protein